MPAVVVLRTSISEVITAPATKVVEGSRASTNTPGVTSPVAKIVQAELGWYCVGTTARDGGGDLTLRNGTLTTSLPKRHWASGTFVGVAGGSIDRDEMADVAVSCAVRTCGCATPGGSSGGIAVGAAGGRAGPGGPPKGVGSGGGLVTGPG